MPLGALFLSSQSQGSNMRICLITAIVSCCALGNGPTKAADSKPITFNKDIAPIIFKSCANCHHPGEVAPFSLLTYEDVRKRDKQIQTVTADRYMPPWKSA